MFDFRYHALSLAAVFLALMVGLLLGVAIGDKGLVSSAEKNLRSSLRKDVRAARAQSDRLRSELAQHEQLENDLYPLLVGGRLSGQRIGLIGLGGLPDATIRRVQDALTDTGGRLAAVGVIREPLPDPLPSLTPGGRPPAVSDMGGVKGYGRAVGTGLADGSNGLKKARRNLFGTFNGDLNGLDDVVLVHQSNDAGGADHQAIDAFEGGLLAGLGQRNVTVAGVESSSTDPSQISWFKDHNLASVDNVDQLAGRASLVFVLAGANGSYGVKSTAQALVPRAPGS
jgi:hypothetical protein